MTPSQQQTIINGVTVEDYEWVIYYNKLVKASKQQPEMAQEQPATQAELLAQIAESQAVTKRLLDKYKTDHWLAPSLSVDAEVFTPEPEPEPESPPPPPPDDDMPEVFLRSPIIRAPTLADRNISHIFAPPPEPVGQEETKGSDDDQSDQSSVCSEQISLDDDQSDQSSVCSGLDDTEPVTVKFQNGRKQKTKPRSVFVDSRWKKSKKYWICRVNGSHWRSKSGGASVIEWGFKPMPSVTDPIIGPVRIIKKNKNSVDIVYRQQHAGKQMRRGVTIKDNDEEFGPYISVAFTNRIYMRQNEAGDGLDDE